MPPRGLTQAASQYGIGPDYDIAGLPTVSGSVPPTVNLTERTEDGFGQGKVLASPFGMALVSATAARGTLPVPFLDTACPDGWTRALPALAVTAQRRLPSLPEVPTMAEAGALVRGHDVAPADFLEGEACSRRGGWIADRLDQLVGFARGGHHAQEEILRPDRSRLSAGPQVDLALQCDQAQG